MSLKHNMSLYTCLFYFYLKTVTCIYWECFSYENSLALFHRHAIPSSAQMYLLLSYIFLMWYTSSDSTTFHCTLFHWTPTKDFVLVNLKMEMYICRSGLWNRKRHSFGPTVLTLFSFIFLYISRALVFYLGTFFHTI